MSTVLGLLAFAAVACGQASKEVDHEARVGDERPEFPVLATPRPEHTSTTIVIPVDPNATPMPALPTWTPSPTSTAQPPLADEGPWLLYCGSGKSLELKNLAGIGGKRIGVPCIPPSYVANESGLAVDGNALIQFPNGERLRSLDGRPYLWSERGDIHLFWPANYTTPLEIYDVGADRVRAVVDSEHALFPRGISPDSEWIIYALCEDCAGLDPRVSLQAVSTDGTTHRDLYQINDFFLDFDSILGWTSESSFVAVRPNEGCASHLLHVDIASEEVEQLQGIHRNAALDPASGTILLESSPTGSCGFSNWEPSLVRISAVGDWQPQSIPLPQEFKEGYFILDVRWIPEMAQFAVWLSKESGGRLFTVTPTGEILHEFVVEGSDFPRFGNVHPSADGRWFVISGSNPFGTRLYDSAGQLIKRLYPGDRALPFQVQGLQWSPDSEALFVVLSSGRALFRFALIDGWELELVEPILASEPDLRLVTRPARPYLPICQSVGYTRLKVGDRISISQEPPLSSRVRALPGLNETVMGMLEPGDEAEIINGPFCGEGFIWWELRTEDQNLVGWAAQGDAEGAWLLPIESSPN